VIKRQSNAVGYTNDLTSLENKEIVALSGNVGLWKEWNLEAYFKGQVWVQVVPYAI
jgi:hypothetical protein